MSTDIRKLTKAGTHFYPQTHIAGLVGYGTNGEAYDDVPTAGSNNLVKSGGIKAALDIVAGTVTVQQNVDTGKTNLYIASNNVGSVNDSELNNFVNVADEEIGKRVNENLVWEVASDNYHYVKLYLTAGKYKVVCSGVGGYIPQMIQFTDSTFTTASQVIVETVVTEKIVTIETGYYVLQWSILRMTNPKIIEYSIVDDEPIANSNNLVKSGGVKAKIDDLNNKIDFLGISNNVIFNSIFDEIYYPPYSPEHTYEVFVNVAYLIGEIYYNSLYLYVDGGDAIVVFDENFETKAEALAHFTGVKQRYSGTGFAHVKPQTDSLRIAKTAITFNNPLTIDYAPNIASYLQRYKLTKKTIVWEGDSICADNSWNNTGWRTRIQDMTGANGVNCSIGGSVITENLELSGGSIRPSVYTRLATDMQSNPYAHYFIFDGGTNDADVIGRIVQWKDSSETEVVPVAVKPAKFGVWNSADFSGSYNTDTFCGAFEQLIYDLLYAYKGKKIGYIIAPKMAAGIGLTFFNRRAYFDEAKAICKKWGVPVIDLWEDTWMNPLLPRQYDSTKTPEQNVLAGNYYLDGQHPAPAGFDYLSPIIANWIEEL